MLDMIAVCIVLSSKYRIFYIRFIFWFKETENQTLLKDPKPKSEDVGFNANSDTA